MNRQGALFILWHRQGRLLTWHAPWCRDADCTVGRWRDLYVFAAERGHLRGFGFELTF